jgi:NAD-dependent SIR2 family protein deacetylase
MSNQKNYIIGQYKDEKTGIMIKKTELRDVPAPCKECKVEPRENASARCLKCKTAWYGEVHKKKILEERIQEQQRSSIKN